MGGPALVIWDGSPIHRRANVTEFAAAVGADGLRLERLPAYAPDLNPVEWLWRHLKEVEMANLTCLDLEELSKILRTSTDPKELLDAWRGGR